MTSELPPVPTTWRALLDRYRASPDADTRGFNYYHQRLVGGEVHRALFAVPFLSATRVIANTLVLGDAAVSARQIAELVPYAMQIARDGDELDRMPPARIATLALIVLADLAGVALPDPAGMAVPRMLAALRGHGALDAEEARQAIWAHLAFGAVEGLGDLLPGDLAVPPEDGAFGPNVQGAQVQIARAIAGRAPVTVVARVWDSYRDHVPRLIAAGQGSMLELILAARAVGCVLGGQAGPQVLDGLRAAVR